MTNYLELPCYPLLKEHALTCYNYLGNEAYILDLAELVGAYNLSLESGSDFAELYGKAVEFTLLQISKRNPTDIYLMPY